MTLGIPSSLADHGRMVSTPIRLVPDDMPEAASLPQNVEAAAALLGALMIDNRLVEAVQIRLKPEHFFSLFHRRIHEAVLKLAVRNMVARPVTMKPLFQGRSEEHTSELHSL